MKIAFSKPFSLPLKSENWWMKNFQYKNTFPKNLAIGKSFDLFWWKKDNALTDEIQSIITLIRFHHICQRPFYVVLLTLLVVAFRQLHFMLPSSQRWFQLIFLLYLILTRISETWFSLSHNRWCRVTPGPSMDERRCPLAKDTLVSFLNNPLFVIFFMVEIDIKQTFSPVIQQHNGYVGIIEIYHKFCSLYFANCHFNGFTVSIPYTNKFSVGLRQIFLPKVSVSDGICC